MAQLKMPHILFLGLILSILTTCNKNPMGIDLDDETEFIPWELITGKIAYRYTSLASDNSVRSSEIIIIDGDQRSVRSFIKGNSLTFNKLAWSADGEKIVYSDLNHEKGRWQLYELNMTSGEQKPMYQSELHNDHPSFSIDGRLSYLESWYGIWIDGKSFYPHGTNLSATSWSPDSKFLVASIRDSTSQGAIYKISLADTTAIPLVQGNGDYNDEIFYDPVWSPDGSRISYVKTSTVVNGSIWLMDADGSNQKELTSGFADRHPEWSPNGESILFERDSQLFIINLDGSELTQITKLESPFHSRYAEWIQ